jgi:hypothetical protein
MKCEDLVLKFGFDFGFVSFGFVSLGFVSFRLVSFRFDWFRFDFVSHFTGTLYNDLAYCYKLSLAHSIVE